jgi:hypothetical protein
LGNQDKNPVSKICENDFCVDSVYLLYQGKENYGKANRLMLLHTAAACFDFNALPADAVTAPIISGKDTASPTCREEKLGTGSVSRLDSKTNPVLFELPTDATALACELPPSYAATAGVSSLKNPLLSAPVGVGLPRDGSGSTPANILLFTVSSGRGLAPAPFTYSVCREDSTLSSSSSVMIFSGEGGCAAVLILPTAKYLYFTNKAQL